MAVVGKDRLAVPESDIKEKKLFHDKYLRFDFSPLTYIYVQKLNFLKIFFAPLVKHMKL